MIDTDPQGSAADWGSARKHAGLEGQPTIERASAATLAAAIDHAKHEGLTLSVIDMTPHATAGVDIIAAAADLLLIPCRASAFDLRAIAASVNVAKAARKPAAFILNACDSRIPEVMEARNVLARHGRPRRRPPRPRANPRDAPSPRERRPGTRTRLCHRRRAPTGRDGAWGDVRSCELITPPDDRLLTVNLGRDLALHPAPELLLASPEGMGWTLLWSSEDPRYDGGGTAPLEGEDG